MIVDILKRNKMIHDEKVVIKLGFVEEGAISYTTCKNDTFVGCSVIWV